MKLFMVTLTYKSKEGVLTMEQVSKVFYTQHEAEAFVLSDRNALSLDSVSIWITEFEDISTYKFSI